ncbi:MAG: hypothetical protein SPJ62_16405 [Inconstantimicrobium porci]|uniref:hypothetical protein n=1 Tax=Inconstantimicrobium porci TaxID=2652291 RepID=UPI00240A5A38|nr:hypothetical protein [Inconstantimicrobium porci]MDD6771693.1 hypothetical protein [Inconstantimicrobium porci]MDY5913548.1 hypothetical protein [Inconstantimicrobium porci]
MSFVETEHEPLISFDDVFSGESFSKNTAKKIEKETHTRLYICAINILKSMDEKFDDDSRTDFYFYIKRFVEFIRCYPADLMVGIMKEMKINYKNIYEKAIKNDDFVELYFKSYGISR